MKQNTVTFTCNAFSNVYLCMLSPPQRLDPSVEKRRENRPRVVSNFGDSGEIHARARENGLPQGEEETAVSKRL